MKLFATFFFSLAFSILSFTQYKITDISPDGKSTNVYEFQGKKYSGASLRTSQDVPYNIAPSWVAKRDRQISGISFGDYDGDGDLDLAVGCYSSQSYPPITEYDNLIFRNDGGVLDTFPRWASADSKNTNDIVWGDVNNDGRPDLLSANGSFQKSEIYFNSATGLSTSSGWTSNNNVWTVSGAFNDINGDGFLDVAFANQGVSPDPYRPIQVFFNNNGTLATTPAWTSSDLMITNSVAFTDVNNSSLTSASISYTGNGTSYAFFVPKVPVYKIDSVKINNIKISTFASDDVAGWVSLGITPANGATVNIYYRYVIKGDMAACKWVSFASGIYFNDNGVLNTSPGWNNNNTSGLKGMAWADIDLDGYMDLAIGGSSTPNFIYKNEAGTLSSTPYWQSGSSSTSVQDLKFADVNRDGYPDLAVVHFGYHRVDIFINRGGQLDVNPTWIYSPTTSSTAIGFGDVNGDGWLDLAVGTARQPVMVFIADPSLVPVELTSFASTISGADVVLNWSTSTEKNNKGFNIERREKIQSGVWESLGFISGNGTTTEMKTYSFTDSPLKNGKYQYRLKQVDLDGTETYSGVSEVDLIKDMQFLLDQNYPNPFNPSTTFSYQLPQDGYVAVKIFDLLGREVSTLVNESKEKGSYKLTFNSGNLSSGIYLYSVNFTDKNGNSSLIVKKMNLIK